MKLNILVFVRLLVLILFLSFFLSYHFLTMSRFVFFNNTWVDRTITIYLLTDWMFSGSTVTSEPIVLLPSKFCFFSPQFSSLSSSSFLFFFFFFFSFNTFANLLQRESLDTYGHSKINSQTSLGLLIVTRPPLNLLVFQMACVAWYNQLSIPLHLLASPSISLFIPLSLTHHT